MPRHPSDPPIPHGATAMRPLWGELPDDVRALVEHRLGAAVVDAGSQGSGFTSGFASRLRLADGRRAFVKAVSRAVNPMIHVSYLDEARIVAALPTAAPAPRLRWTATSGEWLVLAFDDVDGRLPVRPWGSAELDRVLAALVPMAAVLTPAPEGLALPSLADLDVEELHVWRSVAAGEQPLPEAYEPWLPYVDDLAALESTWVEAATGDTLVHFDLRDDNVILAADGRVFVCDWNWPSVGAPWLDLVSLLIGAYGDGHDADALLARHPLARDVPSDAIDAFLAALAGVWVDRSPRPMPSPASPYLRAHQKWYADVTLRWLAERRGWLRR